MRDGRIGFFEGLAAPWIGLRWILLTPSSWPLAAVPAAAFVALFVGLLAGGGLLADRLLESWLSPPEGTWRTALHWLAKAAGWILAVLLGCIGALVLAQPISGPALDALARRREVDLGLPPHPETGILSGLWRSIRVSLFGLGATLVALLALTAVGILFPLAVPVTVPLKFILTGLLLAWDLVDYPLGLRSSGIRSRLDWFQEHFAAALGMGISLWVLFIVPGFGLLLLGAGVVGATGLVVGSEGRR